MNGQDHADGTSEGNEGLHECTHTEAQERVGRVLPHAGSQDMSSLLQPPKLSQTRLATDADRDYLPDSQVEWAITADFDGSPLLTQESLQSIFTHEWHMQNGTPTLYGLSPEDAQWTFPLAGGVPNTYAKLKVAWRLCNSFEDPPTAPSAAELSALAESTCATCGQLGPASITFDCSPENAARKGAALCELVLSANASVIIILQAPPGQSFDGREIWDVMLCLGLPWGDMDLFHWPNPTTIGDQEFFSVWTSTSPGYFLPEAIAAGQGNTEDLIFGYSVPRSAAPEMILEEMIKAARYAHKRLGGSLLMASGDELDEDALRAMIQSVSRTLTEAGFPPGSESALLLF